MASFWPSLTLSVIIGLLALGGLAIKTALEESGIRMTDNKPLVIHMHTTLRILIHGEPITIPKEIGIDPKLWVSHDLDKYGPKKPRASPLHTHDTSGIIHIESTVVRTFTLGQFFDVWGKTFNGNCILDKCSGGLNKVRMYVNEVESFESREHVLRNGEVITIEYGLPKGEHKI